MEPLNKALFSSAKEDWATPQDFFDELDKEFHFGGCKDAAPFPSMVVVFRKEKRE